MQNMLFKAQAAALTKFSLWLFGWLCLLLPTLALTAALPTVSRVKDINTNPGDSFPQNVIKVGNTTFFTAYAPTTGRELWKSDGTLAGTVMVKDINPGSNDSLCDHYLINCYLNFTAIGNVLYFIADNGVNGKELWKSDGTVAGTVMVKDIYPGSNSSNPYYLTAMENILYFQANNGVNGLELWKSDGTATGTVMVKDISPPTTSGNHYYFGLTAVGNVLYFSAYDEENGIELWRSDGTAAGTVMVKDINPGSGGGLDYYSDSIAIGNVLYFAADNGTNGRELWKSDGTEAGTVMVKNIGPDDGNDPPHNFTAVGDVLFFIAYDGISGEELWKSDGTAAGTVMVKDVNPGTNGSFYYYPNLIAMGDVLYFSATDDTNGKELWRSDGTEAGTVMVKNINQLDSSSPDNLTVADNVLYFFANNGVNGYELWRSDGTAAGTTMVKDIKSGVGNSFEHHYSSYLTAVNNVVYFSAYNGVNGQELWRSDGTATGTTMVKDINISRGSHPLSLTAIGNTLYFPATNGVANGYELWKSDGTAAGTVMVKDISSGTNDAFNSYYPNLVSVGNILYFAANDSGINGHELWRSDGTEAGTLMVKDINPGGGNSFSNNLTAIGNMLYFFANSGTGEKLWRSDGTAAGTVMVKDITPNTSVVSKNLTVVGNVLYFSASNGTNGYELWRSNGTAAGTVMVKDINPGISASIDNSPNFTVAGSLLYFRANNGVNGYELWRSNGTAAGTFMIKDIYLGNNDSLHPYSNITANGNVLYFRANNGVNGYELWRSDGTAAGTTMVKDIYPGAAHSINYANSIAVSNFAVMNNALYFTANNGISGRELWRSDGTAAGTIMVKDINSGNNDSYPFYLTTVGNILYFRANNSLTGDELWQTDGTAAGTQVVQIVPGSGGSNPKSLTAVGARLYFSAVDNIAERELWRADTPNMYTVIPNAGNGGLVAPNISQAVIPNSTTKFTVTALPNYNLNNIVGGTCPQGSWNGNIWTTGVINANCTVTFSFTSTLPDFAITNVILDPAISALNGTFTATVTVKNQGPVTAGDGKFLDVWSHQPTVRACGATGNAQQSVGTLAAGESKNLTFTALNAGTMAGMKMFRAFVDSGCGTREENESNNQYTLTYPVNQPTATADLTITDIVINTAAPIANGIITATITVKNQGTTATDGKNLEVWSHQPTAQACGATGNARQTIGSSLAAGATKNLIFTGLPVGSAGSKTLRAYIDSACGTPENDEGNNQMTKAYTAK
jgi:ELWxxDGT repeat protein